jgi:hypothetical protein
VDDHSLQWQEIQAVSEYASTRRRRLPYEVPTDLAQLVLRCLDDDTNLPILRDWILESERQRQPQLDAILWIAAYEYSRWNKNTYFPEVQPVRKRGPSDLDMAYARRFLSTTYVIDSHKIKGAMHDCLRWTCEEILACQRPTEQPLDVMIRNAREAAAR